MILQKSSSVKLIEFYLQLMKQAPDSSLKVIFDNTQAQVKETNDVEVKSDSWKRAIEGYKNIIAYESDHGQAHCYLYECYAQLKDWKAAMTYYQELISRNPRNEAALASLWKIYEATKDWEAACEFCKKYPKEDPRNEIVRKYLKDALLKQAENA
jgi:Predicted N-acetylglucosaminyl transferase